jgi:LysM repeat protein
MNRILKSRLQGVFHHCWRLALALLVLPVPAVVLLAGIPAETNPAVKAAPLLLAVTTNYTVQAGDTFYGIAKRSGVILEKLQAANPGVEPSKLQVGQVLAIPVSGNALLPEEPDQLGTLAVDGENQKIALAAKRGEAWVKDPLQVALHCVEPDLETADTWESQKMQITLRRDGAQVRIILDKTQLADDSIGANKDVLLLHKQAEGFWQIDRHQYGWRCWEDRGHTNYSCVPCR